MCVCVPVKNTMKEEHVNERSDCGRSIKRAPRQGSDLRETESKRDHLHTLSLTHSLSHPHTHSHPHSLSHSLLVDTHTHTSSSSHSLIPPVTCFQPAKQLHKGHTHTHTSSFSPTTLTTRSFLPSHEDRIDALFALFALVVVRPFLPVCLPSLLLCFLPSFLPSFLHTTTTTTTTTTDIQRQSDRTCPPQPPSRFPSPP